MSLNSKALKIPTNHYVGFQKREHQDDLPLGFMTPDGTDKAAEKRRSTVDAWARGYGYHNTDPVTPSQSYENKAMVGFKLGRSVRRYGWNGGGNVKWRIEDPRGFELEISSENFSQLISICNLEKGEFQEEMIWCRLGNENVLVPTDSEFYKTAEVNTERLGKSASIKDAAIGDTLILVNGEEEIYLGKYYVLNEISAASVEVGDEFLSWSDKPVFITKSIDCNTGVSYTARKSSPKIAEIKAGDGKLTSVDVEAEINDLIANNPLYTTTYNYQSRHEINIGGYNYTSYIRLIRSDKAPENDIEISWRDEVMPTFSTNSRFNGAKSLTVDDIKLSSIIVNGNRILTGRDSIVSLLHNHHYYVVNATQNYWGIHRAIQHFAIIDDRKVIGSYHYSTNNEIIDIINGRFQKADVTATDSSGNRYPVYLK